METKEEARKKVLIDYLNELYRKFDELSERVEKIEIEKAELAKNMREIEEESRVAYKIFGKYILSESKDILEKPQSALHRLTQHKIDKPVSIVEALRIIIGDSPTKEFEPIELKNEIELLRKQKLLDSEADNLLWSVHSGLKTLLRENFIIKNVGASKPTYRKKQGFSTDRLNEATQKIVDEILGIKKGNNENSKLP